MYVKRVSCKPSVTHLELGNDPYSKTIHSYSMNSWITIISTWNLILSKVLYHLLWWRVLSIWFVLTAKRQTINHIIWQNILKAGELYSYDRYKHLSTFQYLWHICYQNVLQWWTKKILQASEKGREESGEIHVYHNWWHGSKQNSFATLDSVFKGMR